MDYPTLVIAVLTIAAGAGSLAAWFARSRGTDTIKLLQANIEAYKDSETLKDKRIAYLEGQVVSKDNTIELLTEKARNDRNKSRKKS